MVEAALTTDRGVGKNNVEARIRQIAAFSKFKKNKFLFMINSLLLDFPRAKHWKDYHNELLGGSTVERFLDCQKPIHLDQREGNDEVDNCLVNLFYIFQSL
jgi:hypothetical protein